MSSTSSEDESDKEISVSSTSTPSSSDSDMKSRAKKTKIQKRKPEKKDRGLLGKISDNYVVADLFVSLVLNMSSTFNVC